MNLGIFYGILECAHSSADSSVAWELGQAAKPRGTGWHQAGIRLAMELSPPVQGQVHS